MSAVSLLAAFSRLAARDGSTRERALELGPFRHRLAPPQAPRAG